MNHRPQLSDLLQKNEADFVHATYRALLGRDPDPEGLQYYTGRLRAGFGRRSVLAQIALSPERIQKEEYLLSIPDDAAFVTAAYRALLKREPEGEGFQTHMDALRQAADRRRILADIATSPEAQALSAHYAALEAELRAVVEEDRKARHGFWRYFTRGERMERQLNRHEEQLTYLAHATAAAHQDVQTHLAFLESQLTQDLVPVVPAHTGQSPSPGYLAALSPHARLIYRRVLNNTTR